eukprot:CAMPEP_0115094780 /NCGR_PEP_ID=MMETSP0227-20121206/28597_1 /TAXON_ID=89957 /ORGANISM="Polarella glacialis, Strain CCMP 1383" /LENGTH=251 /DNA_ID=CAMNT_0002487919 /DNA_START=51 /DNA_END=806 /DNA_ORIENTATION=-
MPHVGLLFEIRGAETRPGEIVSIVGARPELGTWDPFDYKAAAKLQLRTGVQYPCWAMSAPVWIELGGDQAGFGFFDSEGASPEDRGDSWSADAQTPMVRGDSSEAEQVRGDSLEASSCSDAAEGAVCESILLEYKYLKDRRQLQDFPSIQWEDCIANRKVMIPAEHGSIWLVSDTKFNESSEPKVRQTTLAEVLLLRGNLDPEWTSNTHQDGDPPERTMPQLEDQSETPGSDATGCSSRVSHHTSSTIFRM